MPDTIPGAVAAQRLRVDRGDWLAAAHKQRDAGAGLIALWATDEPDHAAGFTLRAAYVASDRVVVVETTLPPEAPVIASIAVAYPAAGRMERAMFDLVGVRAEGGDTRPWLRHASWPADQFPLRTDFDRDRRHAVVPERYPFVRVTGDGVHEIAVGPVHAGIIEPGHFRFSVVGEKVLRLEERLGYVHKGIEKRFEALRLLDGQKLAARVSGDSAVAHSWAYCMAVEGLCGVTPPLRALQLRALALERERLANHLGDLGALGNDAGFAVGFSHFMRLKEDLLRLNARAFGARYLMDYVVPGGVAADLAEDVRLALLREAPRLENEVCALRGIYDDHSGIQDRLMECGRVDPGLALRFGLVGLAGRASGQPRDLRCDLPVAPYERLGVKRAGSALGDVAARVAVRFDEAIESLRLSRVLLNDLAPGAVRADVPPAPPGGFGIGLVEGWRGPVFAGVEAAAEGMIRRCHPHDPSWHNWSLLEHAVIGNIVPDFPLINKSFNLSYSGQDL